MGMIPVHGVSDLQSISPSDLPIAPPAIFAVRKGAALSIRSTVSASGVLVTDLQSGQIVYGRDLERRRPIASLTKLMTALLVVETMDLEEIIEVPAGIDEVEGQTIDLEPGDTYVVGDLLTAMLVNSANDAAEVLAYHAGDGSRTNFIHMMNERAKTLGLKNTSFKNPTGLDETQHFSTPRDVSWLVTFALRKPAIADRMATKTTSITSTDGATIALSHTHQLLHSPSAVLMGKTGTTDAAGQCLLSIVREGNREYVVILLHSRERYADMRAVLDALQELSV
jgi:D-alanyl-D-alanine carboxypeptidase